MELNSEKEIVHYRSLLFIVETITVYISKERVTGKALSFQKPYFYVVNPESNEN